MISSAESSRMPSEILAAPARSASRHELASFIEPDRIRLVVDILQPQAHAFARRGRNIFADVIGANRQLAMTAIDQRRELNRAGRPNEPIASIAARIVRPV